MCDCDLDDLVVGGGLGVVFLPLFAVDSTGVFSLISVSVVACFSASFDGLPRIRAIVQKVDWITRNGSGTDGELMIKVCLLV